MTTADEYIKLSDSSVEYADRAVVHTEQEAVEALDAMYRGEERDSELWSAVGVDSELVVDDYDEVDPDDRDVDWILGMAGIAGASLIDFFISMRETLLIQPTSYKEQLLGYVVISKTELLKASKRGFDITGAPAFLRLDPAVLAEFNFLRSMSSVDLYQALINSGGMRPPDKIIADSIGYVSRMTSYRPGSTQFKEAVNNLISSSSKRGLKSMTRRSVQQIFTDSQVAGDDSRLMIWMVEGGPNTCEYCLDRAGAVMPYSQWIVDGLPGADVCAGGDLCNCFLAAY